MAVIGSLAVNIVAKTAGFVSGTRKARQEVKGFSQSVERSRATLRKFSLVMGSAFALITSGRLISSLRATAQELDALGKTADRLGIQSDRLAGLRFAGEQTGVDAKTLDMAMQRMVRRTAEAAKGTGEAKDAIAELGLNAQELANQRPDEIFRQIAEKMAAVPQQSDRVRLAFKLFDSEGVKLVNTLNLGREGLDRLQKQAESLGIAIKRDDIKKVERFNDALNELSKLVGGLKAEIVINVAPAATKVIKDLQEVIQGLKQSEGASPWMRNQFRWTMGIADFLSPGFHGKWGWQQRITNRLIRGDVAAENRRDVADLSKLTPAQRAAMQPFSGFRGGHIQLMADARRQAAAIIESERREAYRDRGPLRQFGNRVIDRIGSFEEAGKAWLNIGRQIRDRWEEEKQIAGIIGGGTGPVGVAKGLFWQLFGGEAVKPALQPIAMGTGINAPLERGTSEAYRALHEDKFHKVMLEQLRAQQKQVEILQAIEQNTVQDIFAME